MDDLKLDATGLHLHLIPTCRQSGQRWQGSRCVGSLHNASWTDEQSMAMYWLWHRCLIFATGKQEMILSHCIRNCVCFGYINKDKMVSLLATKDLLIVVLITVLASDFSGHRHFRPVYCSP